MDYWFPPAGQILSYITVYFSVGVYLCLGLVVLILFLHIIYSGTYISPQIMFMSIPHHVKNSNVRSQTVTVNYLSTTAQVLFWGW